MRSEWRIRKALPTQWIHHPWDALDPVLQAAGVELGSNYPLPIIEIDEAKARLQEALAGMWQLEAASRTSLENDTEEGLGDSSELPQIDLPVQVDMEVEHEQLRNDIQGRRHQDQMVPSLTSSLVRVEEEELSIASSHASDSRAEVPSPTDYQVARDTAAARGDVTRHLSPIGLDHAEHSMGHSTGSWRESGVVPVWSPPISSCSGLFVNDDAGIASSSYLDRHPHSRQLMNWGQLSQTTTRSWEIDNTLQPNAIG